MKKLLAIFLSCAMALSLLAGCTGGGDSQGAASPEASADPSASAPAGENTEKKTYKVGFSNVWVSKHIYLLH